MSGILNRLKGDRSLFAKLQETYPTEIVEPYGEVMIIPAKVFKPEWKERLEAEGVKTYVTSHAGQACFFLRKVEQKQSQASSAIEESSISVEQMRLSKGRQDNTEEKKEPETDSKRPWTLEERETLRQLWTQKVSIEEISKKLGRSVFSIGAGIRHLPVDKRAEEKKNELEWTEEERQEVKRLLEKGLDCKQIAQKLNRRLMSVVVVATHLKKKETKPQSQEKTEDPDLIKEFLSACSLLYPTHKRACAALLKQAAEKILEKTT